MKAEFTIYNGLITGIEVIHKSIGRKKFCKIIGMIPNVKIIRSTSIFSGLIEDKFCDFEMNNVKFSAGEPLGDYDSYWITSESSENTLQFDIIRNFFINYR